MNIKEIISNVTPEQLLKIEENMSKVIPLIESKLPLLKGIEEAWRKEFNVHEKDIFIYSALKTPEDIKLSNGRTISKGTPIVSKEIKSFELMDFLKNLTSSGLSGLIDNLM